MTKEQLIDYLYDNHVTGDLKIEEMAEDICEKLIHFKPCPFCGSNINLKEDNRTYKITHYCHLPNSNKGTMCIETKWFNSAQELADVWNHREE